MRDYLKNILICTGVTVVTVTPVCYMLWRISESVDSVEIEPLTTMVGSLVIEIKKLEGIKDGITRLTKNIDGEKLLLVLKKLDITLNRMVNTFERLSFFNQSGMQSPLWDIP